MRQQQQCTQAPAKAEKKSSEETRNFAGLSYCTSRDLVELLRAGPTPLVAPKKLLVSYGFTMDPKASSLSASLPPAPAPDAARQERHTIWDFSDDEVQGPSMAAGPQEDREGEEYYFVQPL